MREKRQLADLLDIATRYGTPTYVTDARTIGSRIEALRRSLGNSLNKLLYALKANALPEVVELMGDNGVGVDVVSPGELAFALQLGFDPNDIFFSANNMTNEEMDYAVSRGVVVNIGEFSRLEHFARQYSGSRVSIRINPQYGAGHHRHVITAGYDSKFGIPISDLEAVAAVAAKYGLAVVGLHQHIGSGNLDVEPYRMSLEVLYRAAEMLPALEFVNIGGGLGVAYGPDDDELDLNTFASVVSKAHKTFMDRTGRKVELWMEPGRYLVAEAGALLVQVNTIKSSHGHTYVGTNSGMNHLIRPAMYGAYHEVVNLSNPDGERHNYEIVGNICESSDFFARDRSLPEAREGDILGILDAGAYGSSMISEYNLRPAPAEVYIDEDGRARLVRRRESPGELVDRLLARRLQAPG
ncbi:MAG: diaminopimelate decarboxylase [Rhodothermales bacterium]|nr:diaminopimelate decarboxylase [Rhodothermales bacterium]